jgi:hypothetical protein
MPVGLPITNGGIAPGLKVVEPDSLKPKKKLRISRFYPFLLSFPQNQKKNVAHNVRPDPNVVRRR